MKQTPRAWYERLSKFLIENNFSRGTIDTTLFVKTKNDDLLIGATNETLYKEFAKCMQGEFGMSMMGELNYFLGLQIKQCNE